jgi:hypothetical protein
LNITAAMLGTGCDLETGSLFPIHKMILVSTITQSRAYS